MAILSASRSMRAVSSIVGAFSRAARCVAGVSRSTVQRAPRAGLSAWTTGGGGVVSARALSFQRERINFDLTSDESGDLEPFDDWDTDLEIGGARLDRARWKQNIDETGASKGRGKRKRARAFATIRPGDGEFMINGRPVYEYFSNTGHGYRARAALIEPFEVTMTTGQFDVDLELKGGGPTGQSQAARLAIARALQNYDPDHRPKLKAKMMLTVDSRRVEPKKWGRTKARRAWQWVKR